MKPADEQTGDDTPASIRCFKFSQELNETPGGTLFQSRYNPDAPSSPVASIARGEPFVLEGLADDYYDIDVTPPLAKSPGDLVGPDDDWGSGNPTTPRIQVVHLQDYANSTAEPQIWFTSDIIGVRLPAEDGAHYAFVELEFLPDNNPWPGSWRPVRWGYRVEPDQPLTIPP